MIDLHTHSTASDGTFSPEELVYLAKKEKLQALALTDHDTIDGLKPAYKTAKEVDLSFLCGVEISIKFEGPGHFHLLGYFLEPEIPKINETLLKLKKAREERNKKMIEKLNNLGIKITLEELKEIAQGEIGRPHMANLLVKKGVVKSFEEAFQKYLKKDAPAYVPKALLSPEEAIKLILEAKGIPVLAHPVTLKLNLLDLKNYLKKLRDFGLIGVEVFYPEHTIDFTKFLIECAKELGLLLTGGSDFHGENKPDIKLGKGLNNLNVPFECYKNLEKVLKSL
uniref:PHP domain-containing protein n=1 Tax=Thermodesulfobacterium geofontis TaxID=1295609 RepID=A0A7V5XFB9_9BACT